MQPYVPPKKRVGLLVLGVVESGKATTIGHLIRDIKGNQHKYVSNYQKALNEGQVLCQHAWLIDKLKSQRERSQVIDQKLYSFETQRYQFNYLQVPGHKDFLQNLLVQDNSIACAVLIVSAVETSDQNKNQQRSLIHDQCDLANSLLTNKNIIVCVNKMDCVDYAEDVFKRRSEEALTVLGKIGFRIKDIPVIPVSGLKGDNLTKRSHHMPWYKGPILFEAFDGIAKPDLASKLFRFPLQDVYRIAGVGTVPVGRVESGTLKTGRDITFAPSGVKSQIKYLEMCHGGITDEALPGDNMGFSIKNVKVSEIRRGQVVGYTDSDPPFAVSHFNASVYIRKTLNVIGPGFTSLLFCHVARLMCEITELIAKLDRRTGKILREKPQNLKQYDYALVSIKPLKPFSCETFATCPSLGRFFIKDPQGIIGFGIIKEIFKEEKEK